MVASALDLSLVGQVLDERYEILEVIGDGGVGVVYRARRVKLERMVAVKVLHEALVQDDGFVRRFQLEAVAMSRLYHPHCVAVTDFGVHDTRPYLVLEFVPGENIKKLLEQGRFEPRRAVHIALQLLETLTYFHGHHVIHRDLKSENVMLAESGEASDFVKVLDFGMAKILTGPGADSQLSKIGIVPGTPSAMAPEQIRQLPPDPRIDIYATGLLLYEMIVGKRPFTGTDMAAVIKMQVSTPPKPPREILGADALSSELELVIIRALEKDRFDRYGTAAEMGAALRLTPEGRALSSETSTPAPSPAPPQPPRRSRRPLRALLAAVFGATVALAAVAAAQLWLGEQKPPVPRPQPLARAVAPEPVSTATVPPPAPVPVVETWLAHRDLAVTYLQRGQHDEAFREVKTAVGENALAAGADPALAEAAAKTLGPDQLEFVIGAFRSNERLVATLADTAAKGTTSDLRHTAHEGLRMLEQESRADLVAMWLLDLEEAQRCSTMKSVWKHLRGSEDPRVATLKSDLRKRSRNERHVRCLKRLLR